MRPVETLKNRCRYIQSAPFKEGLRYYCGIACTDDAEEPCTMEDYYKCKARKMHEHYKGAPI